MRLAMDVVDYNLRRTATMVNTKFDVSGKAFQAANQMSEQARVVEQKVGMKRRLRNIADDVQRKWPTWQKRYAEFSKTSVGQLAFFGFVVFLFYTGLAFRILNLLFILWWLAPFILIPFSRYFNRKAQEDLRRQAEAQRRAQRNPFFSSPFFSGASARQRPPPSRGQQPRRYNGPGGGGGPVIDVEYQSLDDK